MKVVINSCYGGFSLSPLAIREFAKLNKRKCYFFKTNYQEGGGFSEYISISIEDAAETFSWTAFDVPNPNEVCRYPDNWHELPDDEKQKYNDLYTQHSLAQGREVERNDPNLIKAIKKLGTKKASGSCAELRIIDIPDGTKYTIEEYDGLEHVAEAHQTWY
jgi:hypothetical protein